MFSSTHPVTTAHGNGSDSPYYCTQGGQAACFHESHATYSRADVLRRYRVYQAYAPRVREAKSRDFTSSSPPPICRGVRPSGPLRRGCGPLTFRGAPDGPLSALSTLPAPPRPSFPRCYRLRLTGEKTNHAVAGKRDASTKVVNK